jgi:tRNA 5-methylaminomethyl-2-thiouridine biosynthesis bifunctional protein
MQAIIPAELHFFEAKQSPISSIFDDIYFSSNEGVLESDYVFLQGNKLPERFAEAKNFVIAELGFGSGLNFHLTQKLWQKRWLEKTSSKAHLTYISIEKHPIKIIDLRRIYEQLGFIPEWLHAYPLPIYGVYNIHIAHNITLCLMFMAANEALQQVQDLSIDAWFLDGFAPAKNPQMWSEDIIANVARTMKAGGSFATFTAASAVRNALVSNGLCVEKIKGYGKKRHMLVGHKP